MLYWYSNTLKLENQDSGKRGFIMGRISLLDTMEETMMKFSNGNPGAM